MHCGSGRSQEHPVTPTLHLMLLPKGSPVPVSCLHAQKRVLSLQQNSMAKLPGYLHLQVKSPWAHCLLIYL